MAHEHMAIAPSNQENSAVQTQLVGGIVRSNNLPDNEMQTTFMPVDQKPELPPNMRQWTRWEYLLEYLGYWKYGMLTKALGWVLIPVGILMLGVFPLGGLLCLIIAGRLLDLAWWYNFIVFQFGKNRTLVLVD